MNPLRFSMSRALAVAILGFACSGSLPAEAADDAGFTPLFNGKDFTGWVTPADKALFTVEDGQIVGRTNGDLKKNEFLVTAKPYSDFTLKAKYKFKSGNSGIQIRSIREESGKVSGPQADIGEGYFGSLYEEGMRSKLLSTYPKDKGKALFHEGEWNDMVVTAKGDQVTVSLNGVKTVDLVDPMFLKSGIIALQVHVGKPMEVRFKDLMIKPSVD